MTVEMLRQWAKDQREIGESVERLLNRRDELEMENNILRMKLVAAERLITEQLERLDEFERKAR